MLRPERWFESFYDVNAPLPLASDPVEREECFLQVDVIKNLSSVFEDQFLVHKFVKIYINCGHI